MTDANGRRFVDSHLHVWDLAANPSWYSFPKPGDAEAEMLGWRHELPQRYMFDDHRRAMSALRLDKAIHVMAVSDPVDALDETMWLESIADDGGLPNAIIGSLDVNRTAPDLIAELRRNLKSSRFRGIRLRQPLDFQSDRGRILLETLSKENLIFEVMGHPGKGISEATEASKQHGDLRFVLEHTGWPLALRSDRDHFRQWREEVRAFAAVNGNCIKLSGLGMTYHSVVKEEFSAYWSICLDAFGADRCMFGSNFPVEANYGSFDGLLEAFETVAASVSCDEQDALFAKTAERVYRI